MSFRKLIPSPYASPNFCGATRRPAGEGPPSAARAVELSELRDHSRRSLARVENGRRVLLRRLLVDGQGVVHARWKRRGRED